MNISYNDHINRDLTLVDILLGRRIKNMPVSRKINYSKKDTVVISNEAREMSVLKASGGRTYNTSIDSTIDLRSYIDAARKNNQEVIANAGTEINPSPVGYIDTSGAFRAALTEKYSRLVSEAKKHSNPENYIYQKYFDPAFEYYESNLSDVERRIAYNYEKQMYETGKINGVSYMDSLFRGTEVYGDVTDNDRIEFQRQLVNAQINNILKQSGVNTEEISDTCTFSVDPYSYEITVEGVSDDLKAVMEKALNVGDNGRNLFKHIYNCSIQDGCNSSQVSKAAYQKYNAYQQVYKYTGCKLNELTQKDGTYYTKDGQNILDIVDAAIDTSDTVPDTHKGVLKEWIHELIWGTARNGWSNVRDMNLSILFTSNGLTDLYQSIHYGNKTSYSREEWYSVL